MSAITTLQLRMDEAVRHVIRNYNPQGNRIGWLMLASIFVEAWDLYGIAFVLIFIRAQFHPSALLLGLAAAGTQGGALVGALAGGWLSDRIGRRIMFLSTMVLFIVLALAQAFVTSVLLLAVLRFLLGIPLGSDISNGYTYIMESLPPGEREVVGNRWQFMFALGEIATLATILVMLLCHMNHELVWRITLGLGAVPALIIFLLRHNLPETTVWLIRRGKFREAKQLSRQLYHDELTMLPDEDVEVPQPRPTEFLRDTRSDPVRWRATVFGWIACFAQGTEFSTFAFYLPVLFTLVGVSSVIGINAVTMVLLCDSGDFRLGRSADHTPYRTSRHKHCRLWHRLHITARRGLGTLHEPHPGAALCCGCHALGSLLGCVEHHDHRHRRRQAAISRHRRGLRLYVRQTAVISVDLLVPVSLCRGRPCHGDAAGGDLPAGRPARCDLHPAGNIRLRASLKPARTA